MTLKCQYHGCGTVEYIDDVKGLYSTDDGSMVIVFEDDSTLGIGHPDYLEFVK